MAKVAKHVMLYFPPELIASKNGARCGLCTMFYPSNGCTAVKGSISGTHGVCGLYVNGANSKEPGHPAISKEISSYTEDGPTHCGSCKYYGGDDTAGPCEVVEGTVAYHGCCNAWED